MIKLPKKQTPKESAHPDIHAAAVGWNEYIDEVQRLNATAQPVSDGCKAPEGWKLVPIEPTEEMMRQGFEELSESKDPELGICLSSVYRRILAAVPGGQDD